MAESVKVIVRCRPFNDREKKLKCKNCVFMDPSIMQCSIVNVNDQSAPPKNFTFDGVYDTKSTTENIYNEIAYPLVEGVLEGYNGTVFAYGQTGCGKSYTMQGVKDPAAQRGIIPRSFEHIFEAIDSSENMKYLVHASYLEIYNEEVRDLLGTDVKKKLALKENPDKGVYVADISLHPVHNTMECENLMDRGWANRATGATKMNSESSRSHSIFTINIEMMETSDGSGQHIRKGKLNLVDLAGSERQAKTEATGDRLKEANKINLSLSALGNVISALVDGKMKHIPYRDSKLTRLLQDSLGGNTKTMMVACLSPADNNYDETLSTLRYANRAKNIKNKPKINEDPKDAMLREYQQEIQKLKAMLDGNPQALEGAGGGGLSEQMLEEERKRMRAEHEKEMSEMRSKMESEKRTKAAMQTEIDIMKRQYEEKLKSLNRRGSEANLANEAAAAGAGTGGGRAAAGTKGGGRLMSRQASIAEQQPTEQQAKQINQMQQEAMAKLKKLQEEMIDGGKRAGDRNLKERRKQKKKAAENRLKALGEALGHVDDEDGVLLKVYDDIQEELRVKTDALKKSKQRVKSLNTEIKDLQQEFENDRSDYLDTIRDQERKISLLEQLIDRVQPMIRKDCNYSNLAKMQNEAVWNDETQRWKIPELVMQKTKLPPAGSNQLNGSGGNGAAATAGKRAAAAVSGAVSFLKAAASGKQESAAGEEDGSNADQMVEEDLEEVDLHLQQKLAKSEEEDIAGTYFKPQRANRIMEQAQETKRNGGGRSKPSSTTSNNLSSSNLASSANLSASFNSGLNTFGLNNSYSGNNLSLNGLGVGGGGGSGGGGGTGGGGGLNSGWGTTGPSSMGGLVNGVNGNSSSYASDLGNFRKPSRLEALPLVDRKSNGRGGGNGNKKVGSMLNTMGTF